MNHAAPEWWPPEEQWTLTWTPSWAMSWMPTWHYRGPAALPPVVPSVAVPFAAEASRRRPAREAEAERAWSWPRKAAKTSSEQGPTVADRERRGWLDDIADSSEDEEDHDPIDVRGGACVSGLAAGLPHLPRNSKPSAYRPKSEPSNHGVCPVRPSYNDAGMDSSEESGQASVRGAAKTSSAGGGGERHPWRRYRC